jgi:hypothetical protein
MSINTNDLGAWIRNWVHYDNLALGLNRQAQNARRMREDFETKVIEHLRVNHMENAVIQIAGGRLVVNEEKHSQPLTLTRIEELLHGYYEAKGATGALDESQNIMKFIRKQRGFEVTKRLKKQSGGITPPLPTPPALQGQGQGQGQLPQG